MFLFQAEGKRGSHKREAELLCQWSNPGRKQNKAEKYVFKISLCAKISQ